MGLQQCSHYAFVVTQRYCFVCDTGVADELCPTCGTPSWLPADDRFTRRADEHLREIIDQAQPAQVETPPPPTPLPPPLPPSGDDLPFSELEARRESTPRTPGRWAPIAAVVVSGIALMSVLAGPSGNAPEDDVVETPPVTAQTTTTVPTPGSSRGLWSPPMGTWVGGFGFSPNRPDILYGPSITGGLLNISPETAIVDSLPDGRLVGVDWENGQVVLIGSEESGSSIESAPLPSPGPQSTLPLLSPNGARLAMIDGNGVPYVWTIGDGSVVSLGDSASTAVGAIKTFSWSPDATLLALNAFQGGYYLWDLTANEVSRTAMPGRAIAVSRNQVAAWGSDGLELREPTGRVLRRWDDLSPGQPEPLLPDGAFDPQQRYLAVRGRVRSEGSPDGLFVLSVIGTSRELLTTDPAQGFAWSGDGRALYWLNGLGLQAWSADPELASATLVGRGSGEPVQRLRVYDPAVSPVGHPQLATTALLERRDGTVYLQTMEGPLLLDSDVELVTIIPAGIPGSMLSVTKGEEDQPMLFSYKYPVESLQTLGNLNSLQLPEGARIVRAIAMTPSDGRFNPDELAATRWYLETDHGSILHGPEAELFTTAAEGTSLGLLGEYAFHVTPDGSAIQTIPVGVGINTVLTAESLEAERILALGTIRRSLFVLVETDDGEVRLWQIPADSELLGTPLFPPAPSITGWAWPVYTAPGSATGGTILTEPDTGPSGELLAARIDGPDGPTTVLVAAPLALESVCGASAGGACVLGTWPGIPLGFSPDGHWLLVGDGDRYVAHSTVGRGSVALPGPPPDDVAWVEAHR